MSENLPRHHSWLGGAPLEGLAGTRAAVSPASGEAFAEVSLLDAAQAASALDAARAALPAWRALGYRGRGRMLTRAAERIVARAEELALLVAREQGKPVAEVYAVELFPVLEILRHLAAQAEALLAEDLVHSQVLLFAHKDARLVHEPYGVMLVITPWNYPFGITLAEVAAALVTGNTVVLKPAPATTLVGLALGDLFREAGLPAGVLSVVAVDDGVAAGLVGDPRVNKILFTGSVPTGRRVMETAARNLTPVVLELGGKDAAVVCADADLERAAHGIVWGAFVNAGQTCASVERVYVEEAVAEAFEARVAELARGLKVGDPTDPTVEVGPLSLLRQRQLVEEHVQDAVARGARVVAGGAPLDRPGWFYAPTVLTGATHQMRVMREETFGPVLPIMRVASLEEAVRLANDSDYGLTASAWTRDPEKARRLQRELVAGVVTVNDCVSSFGEPTAPWGGFRHSGIGRTHGLAGLREMVQVKYVTRDDSRGSALWWYPYGPEYRALMETAARALYAPSIWTRLRAQIALLRHPRFWRRARLLTILAHAEKLYH